MALVPPGVSNAAVPGSCIADSPNYLTGAHSTPSAAVFGARAWIEYENPDLCQVDSSSPSVSMAWAMISADSRHTSNHAAAGWAQTGYAQFGGSVGHGLTPGIHVFSQYTYKCKSYLSCTGDWVKTEIKGGVSTSHRYENFRRSDGKIEMAIDGVEFDTTNYDPSGDWSINWEGVFAGETFHKQSDVPGTATDPVSMWAIQKYDAGGGTSYFQSLTTVEQPSVNRYHRAITNPSSGGLGVQIYTSPLTGY